ncbi:MAG: DUF4595 domain-containing protein [Bacteroides sp.]|nr:DUF4595 domain-containing protein [Bacteroides sp.]
MKRICFVSLLLPLLLVSCSDDKEATVEEESAEVSYRQVTLTEVMTSDAQPVTNTQTYLYADDLLTSYTMLQSFEANGEEMSMESTTSVTYSGNQVLVSDDSGNELTYTLDTDHGCATACVWQQGGGSVRQYTFSYTDTSAGKHLLSYLTETLEDASTPYSTVSIDYTDEQAPIISIRIDTYEQSYQLTVPTSSAGTANVSHLPCLFFTESYPLSVHAVALYGGLLGDAFDTLVTALQPTNNSESEEITTYTYTTDSDDILTSCVAKTVSYGSTYRRTINYEIGEVETEE